MPHTAIFYDGNIHYQRSVFLFFYVGGPEEALSW